MFLTNDNFLGANAFYWLPLTSKGIIFTTTMMFHIEEDQNLYSFLNCVYHLSIHRELGHFGSSAKRKGTGYKTWAYKALWRKLFCQPHELGNICKRLVNKLPLNINYLLISLFSNNYNYQFLCCGNLQKALIKYKALSRTSSRKFEIMIGAVTLFLVSLAPRNIYRYAKFCCISDTLLASYF